jgi:hypothetical protein
MFTYYMSTHAFSISNGLCSVAAWPTDFSGLLHICPISLQELVLFSHFCACVTHSSMQVRIGSIHTDRLCCTDLLFGGGCRDRCTRWTDVHEFVANKAPLLLNCCVKACENSSLAWCLLCVHVHTCMCVERGYQEMNA